MHSLGLDIGSSSVKVSLFDAVHHRTVGSATSPSDEMAIMAPQPGWAEQDPELWWHHVLLACKELRERNPQAWASVATIGIAYQMHGLVTLDLQGRPVRPSIIWCDSRAVEVGEKMLQGQGKEGYLRRNLNTPGNFTLSKMRWMAESEPKLWATVDKVMLPGDYIAYRLTGNKSTTVSGVSEMVAWDFQNESVDGQLLDRFNIKQSLFPEVLPNFGFHGKLSAEACRSLGLPSDVELRYRAGDQPNNAFGLGVTEPGTVAMNAGTSGVVYAVSNRPVSDPLETYNVFAHVNHSAEAPRYGMLLCINGCGIVYSQLKRLLQAPSYAVMNGWAAEVSPGAGGLRVLPFGNGAERMLGNRNPAASVWGWDFNRHSAAHWSRAAVEGVAATLAYGIERMRSLGVPLQTVRAGRANLFLNPVFVDALQNMADVSVQLLASDGAHAAAIAAAHGPDAWKKMQVEASDAASEEPSSSAADYAEVKASYFEAIQNLMITKN